jgi:hypothetical protein
MNESMQPMNHLTRSALVVAFLMVAASCSIEDQQGAPRCADGNTSAIAIQSVPTAELVPCFDPLPDGWSVDDVKIDQDGTVIRFDSDRAGDDAAIFHYAETCEPGDAAFVPSEHDGADRYEFIERVDPGFRSQRYYTFEGGCMWWEFDFDNDATAALSIELGDRLVVVTRDAVNESIRESFIDEDL